MTGGSWKAAERDERSGGFCSLSPGRREKVQAFAVGGFGTVEGDAGGVVVYMLLASDGVLWNVT